MAIGQILIPAMELITDDGEPLESNWHRAEINLLIESLRHQWRDRTDFYTGVNMFIYYSLEQAQLARLQAQLQKMGVEPEESL